MIFEMQPMYSLVTRIDAGVHHKATDAFVKHLEVRLSRRIRRHLDREDAI